MVNRSCRIYSNNSVIVYEYTSAKYSWFNLNGPVYYRIKKYTQDVHKEYYFENVVDSIYQIKRLYKKW